MPDPYRDIGSLGRAFIPNIRAETSLKVMSVAVMTRMAFEKISACVQTVRLR